jgi:hypothetical protein
MGDKGNVACTGGPGEPSWVRHSEIQLHEQTNSWTVMP